LCVYTTECSWISVALFSFWPKTRRLYNDYYDRNELKKYNNILYYGYIRFFEPKSYLAKLRDSNRDKDSNLELNYAIQIVINSRIAFRKYCYFRIALVLTLIAILTPPGFILLKILFTVYDRYCLRINFD
jgi:hypothetical protein